jgi:LacI family transcriptional regulator
MSTINDVAKLANVSVKTVSRILTGQTNVSDKIRAQVEVAMKTLEYYPSAAATALRKQTSGIVSLITDNLTTTPDSFEIVAGVQSICEKQGKMLLIGETGGNAKSFSRVAEDFRRHRAEAIIYATFFHKQVHINESFNRCPLILVNCFEENLRHTTILPDDESGGYAAANMLIKAGHKRICHLTLHLDMPAAKLRFKGYQDALKDAGISYDENLVRLGVTANTKDEFVNMPQLLESIFDLDVPPTAIMCGNDKMAMRVYMLVRRMGYRIPEDVSIMGYDNYSMIAENLLPQLTTIQLPYFQMGAKAAELAVNGNTSPEIYKVVGDLILRDSVLPI